MKAKLNLLVLLFVSVLSFQVYAQEDDYNIRDHYVKQEVDIEMRDGIKLHTTIYSPKDTSKEYPIIMQRTPYSSRPYGEDQFRSKIGPNEFLMKDGNIIVYQDVRGRWMSEGTYDNMRAYIPNKKGKEIDEASDTYDTIEWLVNNVENNNGRVGTWGISYPGFYATYSLLSEHPALKAASFGLKYITGSVPKVYNTPDPTVPLTINPSSPSIVTAPSVALMVAPAPAPPSS